ncbi:MAG TPA: RNA polymerase sigma factor [Anaerolineales bacterium]|nr:RNA polymerase sigma factor [Anaerolineales bacterium]
MAHGKKRASAEEQDLLQRMRRLDEAALSAVFDAYYEPLYRYIFRYLRHSQTAEDLTADVFRNLLEQLAIGQGPKDYLKAWLYRVAHNLAIDELRRSKYRDHEPLDDNQHVADPQVGKQVESSITKQMLHCALHSLTSKQRDVLILKFLHGLENEEIAYALRMNVGTVKALQYRGLQALRRYLSKVNAFSEDDL